MIEKINSINSINPIAQNTVKGVLKSDETKDICSFSPEAKLNYALSQAKKKIIETIEKEGVEYGFCIDPEGKIIQEAKGTERNCRIDINKIGKNSILIHGHPKKAPLSPGDVILLLSNDAKEITAVTQDGCYSTLVKKYPFKIELNDEINALAFNTLFLTKGAKAANIDLNRNREDVLTLAKDYLENYLYINCSDFTPKEIEKTLKKYGIALKNSPEEDFNAIKERMIYFFLNSTKYDKLVQNENAIYKFLCTPEGIKIHHAYLEELADKYGLIYKTDM